MQGHSPDERKTVARQEERRHPRSEPDRQLRGAARLRRHAFDRHLQLGLLPCARAGTGRPIEQDYLDDLAGKGLAALERLRLLLLNDDGRADANPAVEVDHIVVGQAEAARRHRLADRLRLIRAVNAV